MTVSGMRGRRTPRFKLNFYAPLTSPDITPQTNTLDYNPDVTALDFTESIDVGFQALTVGYQKRERFVGEEMPRHFGYLEEAPDIRGFAHVTLTEGKSLVWEGRVMLITKPAGRIRGFQAQGYGDTGMSEGVFLSQQQTPISSGELLARAIRAAAPRIRLPLDSTHFVDPNIPLVPANFTLQTPGQVRDVVLKAGDQSANALAFTVYEHRIARLFPLTPPVVPDYLVDFDESLAWEEKFDDTYGTILLTFTGGSQPYLTLPNPDFTNRYGISRTAIVSGGTMDDTHAAAFARTWLKTAASPTIATPITIGGTGYGSVEGLRRFSGGTVAPWLARAGEWIQLGATRNGVRRMLPIIRKSFSGNSLMLTLELGSLAFTWNTNQRSLQIVTRQLANRLAPATGSFL